MGDKRVTKIERNFWGQDEIVTSTKKGGSDYAADAANTIGGALLLHQLFTDYKKNQAIAALVKQLQEAMGSNDDARIIAVAGDLIDKYGGSSSDLDALYVVRGGALLGLGYEDAAISDATRAVEINPRNSAAYFLRGEAYASTGNVSNAIKDMSEVIRIDPGGAARAYGRRASYLTQIENHEAALRDITEAIRLDPGEEYWYWRRGKIRCEMGDNTDAIADFSMALKLKPEDSANYRDRGSAHLASGNYDKAVTDYTTALGLRQEQADVYRLRAEAYEKLGLIAESQKDLQEADRFEQSDKHELTRSSLVPISPTHVPTLQTVWRQRFVLTCAESPQAIAFSPDGTLLASGGGTRHSVRLWHVENGEIVGELTGHRGGICDVAFSPDGALLASASDDHTVRIWRTRDWSSLATLTRHNRTAQGVVFSPDGNLLASCGADNRVILWRASDGSLMRQLEGHTSTVNALAFSTDGTMLASASLDNTAKLWQVPHGALLRTFTVKTGVLDPMGKRWIRDVVFVEDNRTLITASQNKVINLWDVTSGNEIRTVKHSELRHVSLAPGGRLFATMGLKEVSLWDTSSWTICSNLGGHSVPAVSNSSTDVAFSPNGLFLASAGLDKKIIVWEAQSSQA